MKYYVNLTALADVTQSQRHIEADSEKEAIEKAISDIGNHVWKYKGVSDDSIEVLHSGLEEHQ